MDNRKKIAAAISGVMSYIRQEEDMARIYPHADSKPVVLPPVSLNLWGSSGRQTTMQTRNMMQMKAFHRMK